MTIPFEEDLGNLIYIFFNKLLISGLLYYFIYFLMIPQL